MPGWRVFLIEESGLARRSLRRYGSGSSCSEHPLGYHNARFVIDAALPLVDKDLASLSVIPDELRDDSRWPKSCVCGYRFLPEDQYQLDVERLYKGAPDHKLYALRDRDLPIGAAWDAYWFRGNHQGPDGRAWTIRLPGGHEWLAYGPDRDGDKWRIEGTMPEISVHPSINMPGIYHGGIKGGTISDDCDGRKFPQWPSTA